jgi:hypothetical protein
MRPAALSLLALLSGCSVHRGGTYLLHADPAMRPEQVRALVVAADDWTRATGVAFVTDTFACDGSNEPGHICVHPAARASICADDRQTLGCDVDGRTVPSDDGGDVVFDEAAGDELRAILAHEIGHAIAMPDRHQPDGCGALMTRTHESWALGGPLVTERDVAVYWEARR